MTAFSPDKNAVLVGIIISPHGINGALSAECLSDNPRRFVVGAEFFDDRGNTYTIEQASMHKGRLLLRIAGITSRDQAESLRGIHLYIDEADSAPLPEDEFYDYQLVGLRVYDKDEPIGEISEILHYTANDVFVVKNSGTQDILIPALKAIVKQVSIADGSMHVELPDGLR